MKLYRRVSIVCAVFLVTVNGRQIATEKEQLGEMKAENADYQLFLQAEQTFNTKVNNITQQFNVEALGLWDQRVDQFKNLVYQLSPKLQNEINALLILTKKC